MPPSQEKKTSCIQQPEQRVRVIDGWWPRCERITLGLATAAGLGSGSGGGGFKGNGGGVSHIVFVCSGCRVNSFGVDRAVAFILNRTKLNMVLTSGFTLSRRTSTIPFRVPHGGRCRLQGRRPALRVVVLDAAAIVARGAADAAVSSPGAAAVASAGRRLVTAQAQEEEHGGEEESGPRGPAKAKGVPAEGGGASIGLEGITSLDKGGT